MTWKKYVPEIPGKPALTPVSLTISDSERYRPFLSINDATLKQLGWKAGASLQLLVGDGEHDGKIRIEPAAGEPTSLGPPSRTKRATVRIGRMPCLSDREFKGAVPFELAQAQGGATALVVTLPDEARAHRLPKGTAAAIAAAGGKR